MNVYSQGDDCKLLYFLPGNRPDPANVYVLSARPEDVSAQQAQIDELRLQANDLEQKLDDLRDAPPPAFRCP